MKHKGYTDITDNDILDSKTLNRLNSFHDKSDNIKRGLIYSENSYKARWFYHYLYRFLMSNVGNHIDDIYSKFCDKFPDYIGRFINSRDEFRWYTHGKRFYSDFDLNDKDILVYSNKRRKKNRDIIITLNKEEPLWYLRSDIKIRDYKLLKRLVCKYLHPSTYNKIVQGIGITDFEISYLSRSFDKKEISDLLFIFGVPFNLYKNQYTVYDIFNRMALSDVITYVHGTREWFRYSYERRSEKRKSYREWCKARQDKYAAMAYDDIKADNLNRKNSKENFSE